MQGTIKEGLMNRFKEFRRVPRKRSQQGSNNSHFIPKRPKFPGHTCALDTLDAIMKPPSIPPGEDETSFERHRKVIYM